MESPAQSWDRRPDESAESYARFLTYRNLGPGRTLVLAETLHGVAKKRKITQPSGHWSEESSRHEWRDRAIAWDIHRLQSCGEELARLWMALLSSALTKAVERLADPSCRPKDFTQAVSVIDRLAPYITPDVLKSLQPAPPPAPSEPERSTLPLDRAAVA